MQLINLLLYKLKKAWCIHALCSSITCEHEFASFSAFFPPILKSVFASASFCQNAQASSKWQTCTLVQRHAQALEKPVLGSLVCDWKSRAVAFDAGVDVQRLTDFPSYFPANERVPHAPHVEAPLYTPVIYPCSNSHRLSVKAAFRSWGMSSSCVKHCQACTVPQSGVLITKQGMQYAGKNHISLTSAWKLFMLGVVCWCLSCFEQLVCMAMCINTCMQLYCVLFYHM